MYSKHQNPVTDNVGAGVKDKVITVKNGKLVGGINNKSFSVTIDRNLSFREMVKQCGFYFVDPDVNEENFPPEVFTQDKVEVAFIRFENQFYWEEVLLEIKKLEGFKPANIYHGLLLYHQFPEIWELFPAFLGSIKKWKGQNFYGRVSGDPTYGSPKFSSHGLGNITLMMHLNKNSWLSNPWYGGQVFAVVRE